jgi:hypothetical protein
LPDGAGVGPDNCYRSYGEQVFSNRFRNTAGGKFNVSDHLPVKTRTASAASFMPLLQLYEFVLFSAKADFRRVVYGQKAVSGLDTFNKIMVYSATSHNRFVCVPPPYGGSRVPFA